MKTQLIVLVFLVCSISGIAQIKEVIAKSTIKFEGKNTDIRQVIEIDGYYADPDAFRYGGSSEMCRMFFEDGSFVSFYFKEGISENEKKTNMSKSVVGSLKNNQLIWGSWGVYKIERDTIIVYTYHKASFWIGWSLWEERYKIINRTTIKGVYLKSLLRTSEYYYENHSPWIDEAAYRFTPADSLPSSDCWLKEEKWIWRNESDWKEYMQMIEQKKVKKKR